MIPPIHGIMFPSNFPSKMEAVAEIAVMSKGTMIGKKRMGKRISLVRLALEITENKVPTAERPSVVRTMTVMRSGIR